MRHGPEHLTGKEGAPVMSRPNPSSTKQDYQESAKCPPKVAQISKRLPTSAGAWGGEFFTTNCLRFYYAKFGCFCGSSVIIGKEQMHLVVDPLSSRCRTFRAKPVVDKVSKPRESLMTCAVPGSAPGSADALQRSPRNLSHMSRGKNLRGRGGLRSEVRERGKGDWG